MKNEPTAEQMLALAVQIQDEVAEDECTMKLKRHALRWTDHEYDLARALIRAQNKSGPQEEKT